MTLVPWLALEVEGRSGLGLRFVPFPEPAPGRTISLGWRPSSPRGRDLRLLAEELVQEVPKARRLLK